ncbi:hypothetical protein TrST_g1350 [Triparma strigata]|uniref:Uncharacterized protein n=1 Tax=Triparma strigata TaxID=1606541 RepID=A0A9W7EYM7_9STRA|nr:hypothetical protein TrST_g1350 [Triparma strigata]
MAMPQHQHNIICGELSSPSFLTPFEDADNAESGSQSGSSSSNLFRSIKLREKNRLLGITPRSSVRERRVVSPEVWVQGGQTAAVDVYDENNSEKYSAMVRTPSARKSSKQMKGENGGSRVGRERKALRDVTNRRDGVGKSMKSGNAPPACPSPSLNCILFKKPLPNNLAQYLLYANGKRLTHLTARTKIVEVHIGQDNDVSLMTDDGITLDPNAFEIVNGKNKDEKHLLRIPDSEDRLQVYSKWLEAVRSAVGDCILLSALNSSTLSVDNLKIAISKSVTSYGLTIEHETLRKAYEMVNYMRRVEVRARYNNNA